MGYTRSFLAALLLAAPLAGWASSDGMPRAPVHLIQSGRGWLLDARLNDHVTGRFLLDTGATFCVLAPHLADQLGLRVDETIQMQTANGIIDAPVVQLRSLAVGQSNARDLRAVVHKAVSPPLDGVIGLNFLNQFSYSIDPRRRVLELR